MKSKVNVFKFFAYKVINVISDPFNDSGPLILYLYKKFNIKTVVINNKNELKTIEQEQEGYPRAIIINNVYFSNEDIDNIIRENKSSFITLFTEKKLKSRSTCFIQGELNEARIKALLNNFLVEFLIRSSLKLKELFGELISDEKVSLSLTPSEIKPKEKLRTRKVFKFKKETFYLYLLIVIDLIAAIAIGFQSGRNVRIESSIIAINNEQKKNENPYIAAEITNLNLSYEDLVEKQGNDASFNKNVSPYISLGKKTISYGTKTQSVTGLVIKDYLGGETLNNIPLALYAKKQNLFLDNLKGPGIILTSALADSFVETMADVSTYSDLLGKDIIAGTGEAFKVINIIYISDINPHTEIGDDYYRYHEHNIGVGKHLYNLYGEYVFFINTPSSFKIDASYNFAVNPQGTGLVDYIERSFDLDKVEIIFKTQNGDGVMESDNRFDYTMTLLKEDAGKPIFATILLIVLAGALLGLSIKLLIDLAQAATTIIRKAMLLIPFPIYFVITLIVRFSATDINLIAAFSNTAIIITSVIFVICFAIINFDYIHGIQAFNKEKELK